VSSIVSYSNAIAILSQTDKYYFDEKAADNVVKFIERHCRHIAGKWANPRDDDGRPRDTRVKLAEWQKEQIIRPLFGCKVKATGKRRYTTLYVEIPKKNGKSFLSAAIELVFLFLDKEPGAELYIACPVSKDQAASLLLEPCRAMIEKDPSLKKKARIMGTKNYTKSILTDNAFLKPLTRDAAASEGIKPQAAFIDETHVFKDGGVIENLEKSMIIREQPLVCYTTTAGDDMGGVGYEKHEYYKKVREGVIEDDSALVVIYGADPDDDPFDEETWKRANPMWDISINQDQFRKEAAKAMESAASLNAFKRYHLNIWTSSHSAYIADPQWVDSVWDVDTESLKGQECIIGIDLGVTTDTTAICAHFWDGDRCTSLNWFFLPENQGHESMKDRIHLYDQWVQDGFIEVMPGSSRSDRILLQRLLEIIELYDVQFVTYDPYQATHLMNMLMEEGYPEAQINSCRSGALTLSEPTDQLLQMVQRKEFNHLGNPVLRWMNSNVVIKTHGGNMYPTKDKGRHKIDGILANLYALYTKLEMDKHGGGKSYLEETDGILA
jgi:phage terminase large subunit-like protein